MFERAGHEVLPEFDSDNLDAVVFTGGADVSPSMYGEDNVGSYVDEARDIDDSAMYHRCLALGIPMIGICRGGQFLNVMNGGKMWQDVDGHALRGTHALVDTVTGEMVHVTSTHHQMMRPSPAGEVWATAEESTYKKAAKDKWRIEANPYEADVEVVFYPLSSCLCFQPHPEMLHAPDECVEYFFNLVKRAGLDE